LGAKMAIKKPYYSFDEEQRGMTSGKKKWLDKLYYDIGNQQWDFRIFGSKKMEDGSVRVGKWRLYSKTCFHLDEWEDYKIDWINNREILPNEVVLDFDDAGMDIDKKIEEIEKDDLNFYVFFTGSRGYHVHIFFKKELKDEEKVLIISRYGAELQKVGKSPIALEFSRHWKTGNPKTLYYNGFKDVIGGLTKKKKI